MQSFSVAVTEKDHAIELPRWAVEEMRLNLGRMKSAHRSAVETECTSCSDEETGLHVRIGERETG